jgi:hypothetical protein
MAGLQNWKKRKKKEKRKDWWMAHPSLLWLNWFWVRIPKYQVFFKVNLLVPTNLSICWAFIDFGKEWVSEWGTYFE